MPRMSSIPTPTWGFRRRKITSAKCEAVLCRYCRRLVRSSNWNNHPSQCGKHKMIKKRQIREIQPPLKAPTLKALKYNTKVQVRNYLESKPAEGVMSQQDSHKKNISNDLNILCEKEEAAQPLIKRTSIKFQSGLEKKILFREQQTAKIRQYLDNVQRNYSKSSLTIFGTNGLGKTACVNLVIKQYQLKGFTFIQINCMEILGKNPYKLVAKYLKLKSIANNHLQALDDYFTKKRSRPIILIFDEVDTLPAQTLYNGLEWTQFGQAKVGMLLIGNNILYLEKLKPALKSRIGTCQILFMPYSSEELAQISCLYFEGSYVLYAVKATAQYTTDLRKVLKVLLDISTLKISNSWTNKQKIKLLSERIKQKFYNSDKWSKMPKLYQEILTILEERNQWVCFDQLSILFRQRQRYSGQDLPKINIDFYLRQLFHMGAIQFKEENLKRMFQLKR